MGCLAGLRFWVDVSERRTLWRATCHCGWTSAPVADSRVAIRAASVHDGVSATLLERAITREMSPDGLLGG